MSQSRHALKLVALFNILEHTARWVTPAEGNRICFANQGRYWIYDEFDEGYEYVAKLAGPMPERIVDIRE